MAIETIRYVVTGANPSTGSIQITIDGEGNGSGSIILNGANAGVDTLQAFMDSHSFSSNQAQIAWQGINGPIAILNGMNAAFFTASDLSNTGIFKRTDVTAPVFTQQLNSLMFNSYPQSLIVGSTQATGNTITPFSNFSLTSTGQFSQLVPCQSGSIQAGISNGSASLSSFDMVLTGSFVVSTAGNYSFVFYSDDGCLGGFGGGATVVSAPNITASGYTYPLSTTPTKGYPIQFSLNQSQAYTASSTASPTVINFPTPGIYPFEFCYSQGVGTLEFSVLCNNAVIPPIAPVAVPNDAAGSGVNLQLTPTLLGPEVLGVSHSFSLTAVGISYSTVSYVGLLEGKTGSLLIQNNGAPFTFPTVDGNAIDKIAGIATFAMSGSNSAWADKLSITYDGSNYNLNYNGNPSTPSVDLTTLVLTNNDIAWYNATSKSIDTFQATSQGGGQRFSIPLYYFVNAAVANVTPLSVPGDGAAHIFTITLKKPLPPLQVGTTCTVTFSGGNAAFTVNSVNPILDSNGWTTGFNVNATVQSVFVATSATMHVVLAGTITYLNGTSFTTGAVTYSTADVATISVTANAVSAPKPYTFSVKNASTGLSALVSDFGDSSIFSCTIQGATATIFGNLSFYYQFINDPDAVNSRVPFANGTVAPTNIRASNNSNLLPYLADYTLTVDTSELYSPPNWYFGYITVQADGQILSYFSPSQYTSTRHLGGDQLGGDQDIGPGGVKTPPKSTF